MLVFRLCTGLLPFTVLYKGMYTKIVVVVNGDFSVDKSGKPIRVMAVRESKVLGQSLYRAGTVVGQKKACGQKGRFCTSRPVDIQRLIHNSVCEPGSAQFCFDQKEFDQRIFFCEQQVDLKQSAKTDAGFFDNFCCFQNLIFTGVGQGVEFSKLARLLQVYKNKYVYKVSSSC